MLRGAGLSLGVYRQQRSEVLRQPASESAPERPRHRADLRHRCASALPVCEQVRSCCSELPSQRSLALQGVALLRRLAEPVVNRMVAE